MFWVAWDIESRPAGVRVWSLGTSSSTRLNTFNALRRLLLKTQIILEQYHLMIQAFRIGSCWQVQGRWWWVLLLVRDEFRAQPQLRPCFVSETISQSKYKGKARLDYFQIYEIHTPFSSIFSDLCTSLSLVLLTGPRFVSDQHFRQLMSQNHPLSVSSFPSS